MDIQKAYDVARTSTYATNPKTAAQETQKKNTTLAADNTDKLETSSTSTYSSIYNKGAAKTDHRNIGKSANASARQMKNDAVRSMVQSQVSGQVSKNGYKPLFGNNPIISNALQAAEATSEKYDDYWGVDATADRIFTFAKNLAGDNDEMFQTMKDAFLKGFKQAEGSFSGGKLPSISYQTKDKVLSMFDDWEKEINAKKEGKVSSSEETKSE